jgi:hypothetical protein
MSAAAREGRVGGGVRAQELAGRSRDAITRPVPDADQAPPFGAHRYTYFLPVGVSPRRDPHRVAWRSALSCPAGTPINGPAGEPRCMASC